MCVWRGGREGVTFAFCTTQIGNNRLRERAVNHANYVAWGVKSATHKITMTAPPADWNFNLTAILSLLLPLTKAKEDKIRVGGVGRGVGCVVMVAAWTDREPLAISQCKHSATQNAGHLTKGSLNLTPGCTGHACLGVKDLLLYKRVTQSYVFGRFNYLRYKCNSSNVEVQNQDGQRPTLLCWSYLTGENDLILYIRQKSRGHCTNS